MGVAKRGYEGRKSFGAARAVGPGRQIVIPVVPPPKPRPGKAEDRK